MTILIVDDKEENRYLLEMLLKGNGHDVQIAANGSEALEILEKGGINLIISDILMPVMDGFLLCRTVKASEKFRTIPLVFYTATYTDPKDEAFALMIGADRFIVKPCEPDHFMAVINEVLANPVTPGATPPVPIDDDQSLMLYTERLVKKLEQKVLVAKCEIKAREEAEHALRKSQDRLITAQRLARMGDFTWDVETGAVTWSEAMYDLLGYEASEPVDFDMVNTLIHHPQDLDRVTRWLHVAIESDTDALPANEYRVRRKNGEVISVRTVGTIRRRPDRLPEIFATVQDITERKWVEEALRDSEEKYRTVLDNIEAGYYEVDLGGNFVFFNQSMCNILGYTPDELMGLNFREYIDEENARIVFKTFNRVFATGEPSKAFDWEFVKKNGNRCHIDASVTVMTDAEGHTIGFRGITRDITERKRAEAERLKLKSQLIQAQKMEAVGRLAGGVAHDYNNMLSVIIGYSELVMLKMPKENPLQDYLKQILDAAHRSSDITRQLLAFARKQTIAPRLLDLNETVEGMLKMLRRLIGEDVELSWKPCCSLGYVSMDPSQVDQILANLCVNARDAIGGVGRITIETGTVSYDQADCKAQDWCVPGDFVQLAVSDDGCGMDKETLDNLFEPYFTTKEVGKGTGLGLATVYGIVKQNGGFIHVGSEPEKGSTFRILLPRHHAEEIMENDSDIPPAPLGNSETVLIVEDEDAILTLAGTMLEHQGYTVLRALSPSQAITLAKSHVGDIHLMITDVVMPEMNGRDLADYLHQLYPKIKILFMSGYTADVIAHRGVLDEGVNFIQKPFSNQDLAIKVHKALAT